ncbi:MAG: hypothetical protein U1F43_10855 [Myxococcota bacterium]
MLAPPAGNEASAGAPLGASPVQMHADTGASADLSKIGEGEVGASIASNRPLRFKWSTVPVPVGTVPGSSMWVDATVEITSQLGGTLNTKGVGSKIEAAVGASIKGMAHIGLGIPDVAWAGVEGGLEVQCLGTLASLTRTAAGWQGEVKIAHAKLEAGLGLAMKAGTAGGGLALAKCAIGEFTGLRIDSSGVHYGGWQWSPEALDFWRKVNSLRQQRTAEPWVAEIERYCQTGKYESALMSIRRLDPRIGLAAFDQLWRHPEWRPGFKALFRSGRLAQVMAGADSMLSSTIQTRIATQ